MTALLLGTGLVLIAVSFAWSSLPVGKSAWTPERALQHQAASANLHGLSHKYAHELEMAAPGSIPDELREARGEFTDMSLQLDAARDQPRRIATALRLIGIGLSLAGAVAYFSMIQQ